MMQTTVMMQTKVMTVSDIGGGGWVGLFSILLRILLLKSSTA